MLRAQFLLFRGSFLGLLLRVAPNGLLDGFAHFWGHDSFVFADRAGHGNSGLQFLNRKLQVHIELVLSVFDVHVLFLREELLQRQVRFALVLYCSSEVLVRRETLG